MTKNTIIIYLGLIMALAIFFRLFLLGSVPPGLYPDEAMNGNNILEAMETSEYKWFYPENNGREGLFINIQALSVAVFGNAPWALRLVAAFFGILTALGIYFLTKELFKKEHVALFSAFFYAVGFWPIILSRLGFRANMAPFFLVWSFYFFYKTTNSRFPNFISGVAGLLFGLGFHSYIAYRAAPLLLIFPFFTLWKNPSTSSGRDFKKQIFVFLFFALLAGLPLGLYFLDNPADFMGRTTQVSVFSGASPVKDLGINIAKTIGMFFVWGDGNWRHNLPHNPELWWPVAILFAIGIWKLGILDLFKNLKFKIKNFTQIFLSPGVFLLAWILVMLLPVVVSNEGLPHALRAIIVIPPVMIFAGLGLEILLTKINSWLLKKSGQFPQKKEQILRIRKELVVALFLFFFITALNSFGNYFFKWSMDTNTYSAFEGRYAEMGRYLKNLPTTTEKYVVVNAGGVLVNGIPMPSQTIMFLTDTYTETGQKEKNIKYILPKDIYSLKCAGPCVIVLLAPDGNILTQVTQNIPGLTVLRISPVAEIYTNY